jgi:exodeoxyribonuclease VII large subunit
MDLIDAPDTGDNAPEFSVSEISGAVKRMIEGEFSHIRVRAEVGRVSRPRSGHVYLDLKDDRSVLAGVMWKGVASRLQTQPEEGMEVVATGRLTTFPGQSKYQMVIEDIRPAGVGALMAMLEKRKAQFAAEGLFDPARKKPLPFLPEIIGVVTSPSGAVIRDILHRLRDRFPRKVLVWPVAVQGDRCAPEVARAIEGFNRLTPGGALPRPDLIIVARGGGSVEDLWGFNEEAVVRAAAASEIPLISAVGHETDTTLIDFASDKRAPTPTAAAELAVPVRLELMTWVDGQGNRLLRGLESAIRQRRQRLGDLSRALPRPAHLLDTPRQRLDVVADRLPKALISGVQKRRVALSELAGALRPRVLRGVLQDRAARLERASGRITPERVLMDIARKREAQAALAQRLDRAARQNFEALRTRLDAQARMLDTLSYQATLQRGYAVVRSEDDALVTARSDAARAALLEIEFADGKLQVRPDGAAPRPTPKPRGGGSTPPPEQGSLF